MGRPPKNSYVKTIFAKRITELQLSRGYSTEYVLEHLCDDNGIPLINDKQVLDSYKSGKRKPRDFDVVLSAFSRFYDVTTDYLLGVDDTPNPQIKSVQEYIGLSDTAVRQLTTLKNESPVLLEMIDTIISAASGEDISSLYTRIYKDYKDSRTPIPDIFRDMYQSQQDSFAKGLYRFILSTVIDRMAPLFDKEMCIEADSNQYEQTHSAPSEQTATTNIILTPTEDSNNNDN